MTNQSVTHHTYVIERSYPAAPARVFEAFSDPVKKRRWFAEGEQRPVEKHELDFRVGGVEQTSSRFGPGTPFEGTVLKNDTVYQDIVPDRRIVFAYTMTMGDHRFSASLVTVELTPAGQGTKLVFTEQAAFFEGADGPQIRERGWQGLLDRLASAVASYAEIGN